MQKHRIDDVLEAVLASYVQYPAIGKIGETHFPKRHLILSALKKLQCVIFPGFFDEKELRKDNIRFYTGELLEEIRELLDSGIPADCTAMQAIGYKEFVAAMKGHITIQEAAEEVKKASRHYAKRQLTWFKRNKNMHWLTRTADTSPEEILRQARQLAVESDK